MRTTLLRKRTALIVLAAAIALCTTACFPDAAPGEPANAYVRSVFRAVNQDRASAGLPALSYSPKLENLAGNWAWQNVGRQLPAPPGPGGPSQQQ